MSMLVAYHNTTQPIREEFCATFITIYHYNILIVLIESVTNKKYLFHDITITNST